MPDPSPDQRPAHAWLTTDIAGKIAAVSSAALVLSAVHERAYFAVVGPDFQSLMSVSDYFNTTLLWLLPLLVGFVMSAMVELWLRRVEHGQTEEELVARSPNPRWTRRFRESSTYPIKWIAICSALVNFIFYPVYDIGGYFVAWFFGWIWFINYLFSHPTVSQFFPLSARILFIAVPIFLAGSYYYGLRSAYADLGRTTDVYLIVTAQDPSGRPVIVLRSLQKGVLLRWPSDSKDEFVRWEDIRSLSHFVFPPSRESTSCQWFGFPCLERKRPPPPP